MLTQQEENELFERFLLRMPEVIGNLIINQISMIKINREFYAKFPDLKDKKDIVASVVEMLEGSDPNADYKVLLEQAIPEIKKRIKMVNQLNMKTVNKPDRNLSTIDFSNNGEL